MNARQPARAVLDVPFVQLLEENFKMNRASEVKSAVLLALLSATLIAPISAQAQSGKRMCGQWAALPNGAGYAALVVEVPRDNTDEGKCTGAENMTTTALATTYFAASSFVSAIPSMTWTRVHEVTCESVGKNFISADHTKEDMCQYMDGFYNYTVVKDSAKNTTVYTKKEAAKTSTPNGGFNPNPW
jgi:hypothetical protein